MATVLVTGASSGVGRALAELLVESGHRVVLAVRDVSRGESTRESIRARIPDAVLDVERVDLTDLDSVRALAARSGRLDVLVNNAGVAFEPLRRTKEGVVEQFAANHLGHFALTALLFDRLTQSADPRVVTVTSTLARKGTIEFDDLSAIRGFDPMRAYSQSKVANVFFGAELDRRLRASRSRVKSVLVHPGVPRTAMQQKARGVLGVVVRTAARAIGAPPDHGARAVLEAAVGAGVESGQMFAPARFRTGSPRREDAWPTMRDLESAARLWERSEALTGIRFDIGTPR